MDITINSISPDPKSAGDVYAYYTAEGRKRKILIALFKSRNLAKKRASWLNNNFKKDKLLVNSIESYEAYVNDDISWKGHLERFDKFIQKVKTSFQEDIH